MGQVIGSYNQVYRLISSDVPASGSTIVYNGSEWIPALVATSGSLTELDLSLTSHIENLSNPHSVTKLQIGLGNVSNVDTTNASNITSGTLHQDRLPSTINVDNIIIPKRDYVTNSAITFPDGAIASSDDNDINWLIIGDGTTPGGLQSIGTYILSLGIPDAYTEVGYDEDLGGIYTYGLSCFGQMYVGEILYAGTIRTEDIYTNSSSGIELFSSSLQGSDTLSSGTSYGLSLVKTYNQTGTAGSIDFRINRTDTAIGSGSHSLIWAGVGGTNVFNLANNGVISIDTLSNATYALNVSTSSSAATARVAINNKRSSGANSGIELQENSVKKWTIATYNNGTFTFYNESTNSEAIGITSTNTINLKGISNIVVPPTKTNTSGTNVVFDITQTYNQPSGSASNIDFRINRTETALGSGDQYFAWMGTAGSLRFGVFNNGSTRINAPSGGDASYQLFQNNSIRGQLLYRNSSNAFEFIAYNNATVKLNSSTLSATNAVAVQVPPAFTSTTGTLKAFEITPTYANSGNAATYDLFINRSNTSSAGGNKYFLWAGENNNQRVAITTEGNIFINPSNSSQGFYVGYGDYIGITDDLDGPIVGKDPTSNFYTFAFNSLIVDIDNNEMYTSLDITNVSFPVATVNANQFSATGAVSIGSHTIYDGEDSGLTQNSGFFKAQDLYAGGLSGTGKLYLFDGPYDRYGYIEVSDDEAHFVLSGAVIFQDNTGTNYANIYAGESTLDSIYFREKITTPPAPTSNGDSRIYVRGDKLIVMYNHSGTVKYRYMLLTSTDAVWTYTTTEPT